MERIEHREIFKVGNGLSMESFVMALLPMLQIYRIKPSAEMHPFLRHTCQSAADKFDALIGDPIGAHLKYSESYYPGCGYDGRGSTLRVEVSTVLAECAEESFAISLDISEYEYEPSHFTYSFTGSLEDFEWFQRSIAPVLTSCALDGGKVISHAES